MSDEVIEQAVNEIIFRIYGGVIATLLIIFFMVVAMLLLLHRGDYLYSALIGTVIIIVIFIMLKGIQRAQRYEEALLKKSRDSAQRIIFLARA